MRWTLRPYRAVAGRAMYRLQGPCVFFPRYDTIPPKDSGFQDPSREWHDAPCHAPFLSCFNSTRCIQHVFNCFWYSRGCGLSGKSLLGFLHEDAGTIADVALVIPRNRGKQLGRYPPRRLGMHAAVTKRLASLLLAHARRVPCY
jgi:hypothetical protein